MLVQWIKPILSNSDDTFLNNSLELKLLNHHFKINDNRKCLTPSKKRKIYSIDNLTIIPLQI